MPAGKKPSPSHSPSEPERIARAMIIANQIREELLACPEVTVRIHSTPLLRLVHDLETAEAINPKEADMTVLPSEMLQRPAKAPCITITQDELKRLRRIVQLLSAATGELSIWLTNAGRDPVEIES